MRSRGTFPVATPKAGSLLFSYLSTASSQVNTARERHRPEHDPVVEATAGRRQVVIGEKNVVVGGRRVQAEPRNYRPPM